MRRPTPSLVISVLALVIAMGGTSYAVNTIGAKDIRKDAVRSVHIKDGTVKAKDLRANLRKQIRNNQMGPVGPAGPPGAPGEAVRWVLVNADGEIEAQSGGFTMAAAYVTLPNTAPEPGDNSLRANGNVYIDAGEDLSQRGIVASIALQNQVDQNADGIVNGRAPGDNANPEFAGEISVAMCGLTGVVACAPPGTNNNNHFVISPRLSNGEVTTDDNRKRFYVIISGGGS